MLVKILVNKIDILIHDDANVSNCFLRPSSSMISILNIWYQRVLFYNSINTFCFCAFGLGVVFLLWRRQRRHLEPPDARVPHGVQAAGRGVPRERGTDLRQRRHPKVSEYFPRCPSLMFRIVYILHRHMTFKSMNLFQPFGRDIGVRFCWMSAPVPGKDPPFPLAPPRHLIQGPCSIIPFTIHSCVHTRVHHAKFANDKIEDNFVWCIDILAGCCHYPVCKYFMFQKVSGGKPHKFVFLLWVYHQSQCASSQKTRQVAFYHWGICKLLMFKNVMEMVRVLPPPGSEPGPVRARARKKKQATVARLRWLLKPKQWTPHFCQCFFSFSQGSRIWIALTPLILGGWLSRYNFSAKKIFLRYN